MSKPQPTSNKILLALQYWKQDKTQALRLARFIADLEKTRCNSADFLFVSRFDCTNDPDTITYVSRRFNVYSIISRRREIGWPQGCNGLWFATMDWFYQMKETGRIPNYKAILTFEADCAPLVPDWISRLSQTWDKLTANPLKPVFIAGALLKENNDRGYEHINGNALISGDPRFLKWVTRKVSNLPRAGWDWALAPSFRQWGWANIPEIRSLWRKEVLEPDFQHELNIGTILYHGCKTGAMLDFSRQHLLK